MNRINKDIKDAKILIIDDEAANVKLLVRVLNTSGYTNVIGSQDPLDTVLLFTKQKSDLIILDLNMPKLDGYAVMEQLKKIENVNLPPILVLTAQHMQSYRQRALDLGAIDYVTKPFDMNELLSRVRNLLEVQMAHKFMRNQNQILEQEVSKRTQALNKTRLQVVRCLGRAAEYRDEETGLHIIRMSKMAVILGRSYGMDEQQCDLLLNAAPMHDIGKIGIPDHILLKPGRFEHNEWEIMKQHAQIGADILSEDNSDLMKMARDIALTHHEKWNGEGYPNKLKENEIPLVGRLCAISDVFDALTSKRPYKKAWSVNDAVKLIVSESGKHFEPKLVTLFVENINAIEEIKDKYAEPNK